MIFQTGVGLSSFVLHDSLLLPFLGRRGREIERLKWLKLKRQLNQLFLLTDVSILEERDWDCSLTYSDSSWFLFGVMLIELGCSGTSKVNLFLLFLIQHSLLHTDSNLSAFLCTLFLVLLIHFDFSLFSLITLFLFLFFPKWGFLFFFFFLSCSSSFLCEFWDKWNTFPLFLVQNNCCISLIFWHFVGFFSSFWISFSWVFDGNGFSWEPSIHSALFSKKARWTKKTWKTYFETNETVAKGNTEQEEEERNKTWNDSKTKAKRIRDFPHSADWDENEEEGLSSTEIQMTCLNHTNTFRFQKYAEITTKWETIHTLQQHGIHFGSISDWFCFSSWEFVCLTSFSFWWKCRERFKIKRIKFNHLGFSFETNDVDPSYSLDGSSDFFQTLPSSETTQTRTEYQRFFFHQSLSTKMSEVALFQATLRLPLILIRWYSPDVKDVFFDSSKMKNINKWVLFGISTAFQQHKHKHSFPQKGIGQNRFCKLIKKEPFKST